MKFNLTETPQGRSIACVINGELYVADASMPQFDRIVEGARNDDNSITDLFTPLLAIAKSFKSVTERVTLSGGNLFFDGVLVEDALADQIVRFYEAELDYLPLANFMEKVYQNPNEHSREHLFRWISAENLSITPSGDIVGYKGVTSDLLSLHRGYGIVNGEEFEKAALDNSPGNLVTMPRDRVTFDPNNGCSFGLHVGTFSYANSYGSTVLEVHVNPRDVVSVPTDCQDQKMRTCRYEVVQVVSEKYAEALVGYLGSAYEDDEDDADYCEECSDELGMYEDGICSDCESDSEFDNSEQGVDVPLPGMNVYTYNYDNITGLNTNASPYVNVIPVTNVTKAAPVRDKFGRFAPKAGN
jgi:hypothetical protein